MCPRIETARLLLRPHTELDLSDLADMWAHPDVVRHITGKPSTLKESWFRLLRYRGLWSVLGYGYWCVCEKGSGRYVDDVGFVPAIDETLVLRVPALVSMLRRPNGSLCAAL